MSAHQTLVGTDTVVLLSILAQQEESGMFFPSLASAQLDPDGMEPSVPEELFATTVLILMNLPTNVFALTDLFLETVIVKQLDVLVVKLGTELPALVMKVTTSTELSACSASMVKSGTESQEHVFVRITLFGMATSVKDNKTVLEAEFSTKTTKSAFAPMVKPGMEQLAL